MMTKHLREIGQKVFFKRYLVAILLVASILTFTIAHKQIVEYLYKQNMLPNNETFTELYINDHTELPVFLAEDTVATASFTIRNNEFKQEEYDYVVSQTLTEKKIIASGSVTLKHNESIKIPVEFTVATTEAKTRIAFELPEKSQFIHFWVNNK